MCDHTETLHCKMNLLKWLFGLKNSRIMWKLEQDWKYSHFWETILSWKCPYNFWDHISPETEKGAIYFLLRIPHLKPQGAVTEAPLVRLLKGGEENHTSARRAVWGRAEWSTRSRTPGAYSRGEGGEVTLSGTPGDLAWRAGKKKPCSKPPGVWWSPPLFQFFPGKPGGRFFLFISVSASHSV